MKFSKSHINSTYVFNKTFKMTFTLAKKSSQIVNGAETSWGYRYPIRLDILRSVNLNGDEQDSKICRAIK